MGTSDGLEAMGVVGCMGVAGEGRTLGPGLA
jgi:hypothetical protein